MNNIIHELPRLYQINARKQIYQWSVFVTEDSDGHVFITTEHGVKDGNLVPHIKEITVGKGVGKAKKTIREQAIFEANSAWRDKKQKNGYQEVTGYGESDDGEVVGNAVADAEDIVVANAAIMKEIKTPFYPMLANTFNWDLLTKKRTKFQFPVYVQRKYDGIRCSASQHGYQITLKSRKGKEFHHMNHVRIQLAQYYHSIAEKYRELSGEDVIFDGELYTSTIPFEQISGIVRRVGELTTNAEQEAEYAIEYHIYDCFIKSRSEWTFSQRWNFLEQIIGGGGDGDEDGDGYEDGDGSECSSGIIRLVPTYMIQTKEEIKQYHDQFVAEGFEGIMIRSRDGVYEPKKRSAHLLKYKEFMEGEFEICGFHEGEGDDVGTVIWECVMKNGKVFSVKPKGTREERRAMLENVGEYIGKKLTVIYQELTADGIPRFPVGKVVRDYE